MQLPNWCTTQTATAKHTYAVVPRDFLCECQLDLEHATVPCQLSSCTHKNKTKHLTMEFVVNMGSYQLLHNRHPKLAVKAKPNLKKHPQTLDVWLFKTSARQLNIPVALWQALGQNWPKLQVPCREAGEGWHSPTTVKRPINNILTIFTSVLIVCISAVLAFVLIQHYHLQALVSTIILASASRVAEVRSSQKLIYSNPELTAFASIVTFIGVNVWIMVHCRQMTWLWGFWYNRTCTLYISLFNTHFYIPIKVKHLSGNMHMYKV